jgi:hypothetical protein
MSKTLYMVIENFKNGDAVPVYRRFRDHGRLAPAGLSYVSSWVKRQALSLSPADGNGRSRAPRSMDCELE